MVVLPAALTLLQVAEPRPGIDPTSNPTPLGYTWSLLLFLVPLLVLAVWLLRTRGYSLARRSFWRTLVILVPLGIVLDLLFGTTFFVFPNREATLGIDIPSVGGSVPLGGALLYKKVFSEVPSGFPWYFTYLLAAAIVPSMGLYRSVAGFINWRAFSITFFFMLLVSLLWEATLGVPYGWWNYNHDMMVGIFVDAWSELPMEAVLVWLAVTYTSVIVYEAMKIWQASGKSVKDVLLGSSET